mgnify:FL=1
MEKRSTLLITSPSHNLEIHSNQKPLHYTTYRVGICIERIGVALPPV